MQIEEIAQKLIDGKKLCFEEVEYICALHMLKHERVKIDPGFKTRLSAGQKQYIAWLYNGKKKNAKL